jgi:hypothetical protein
MLVAASSHISPLAPEESSTALRESDGNSLAITNVGLHLSLENQSTFTGFMHASAARAVLLFGASSFNRGLKAASGGHRSKTSPLACSWYCLTFSGDAGD